MKEITYYKADDGSVHSDKEAALKRDDLVKQVENAMSGLVEKVGGTDFANGGGYIQHNPAALLTAMKRLIVISEPYMRGVETCKRKVHPNIYARHTERETPLCVAWLRINDTDLTSGREYGQQYYKLHPQECEDICLRDYRDWEDS